MFNKLTTFSISSNDIEILDGDMIKTASEFLFPEGHAYDPDFLYLKVRGISAGEYWGPNKNADYFPEKELIKTYKTFLNAHSFKNHENKKVENAIGDVIDAKWNDVMKHVDLIIRIDRKLAPSIVRAFEKGFMTDVSMGCKIKHSICSICGNVAQTRAQYCDHILNEKHKVYPDGRRTYEINIEPNFHDISVVLNGADRTAKATGIHIVGDKVAYYGEDNDMQKVASTEDEPMSSKDIKYTMEQALEKIAKTEKKEEPNPFAEYSSLVNKNKGGIAKMKKVAELAKNIQGKITSIVNAKSEMENEEVLDDVAQKIKMFYTKYMTQDKCQEIANEIKNISLKHNIPVEQAFDDFIKLLNVTGVELSPLELDRILKYTNGITPDESDLDSIVDNLNEEKALDIKDSVDSHVFNNMADNDINMPTAFNTFRSLIGQNLPSRNISIIIKRISPMQGVMRPSVDTSYAEDDIFNMIRPMLEDRSNLRPFLMPRVIKLAMSEENDIDIKENIKHFITPMLIKEATLDEGVFNKYAVSAYEYSAYQNNKCNFYESEEEFSNINKYAFEMGLEKIAENYSDLAKGVENFGKKKFSLLGHGLTTRKALLFGIPAAAIYSKYQRSRINNGERVSSPEAFIAENPEIAMGTAAALSPMAVSKINNAGNKLKFLKTVMKKTATENHIIFDKYANYIYTDNILEDSIDIFKCASIDKDMSIEYNGNQIDAIKLATVLKCMDREDLAEEKMASYGVSNSDINKYLHICEKYIKIEISKQATELEEKVINILKLANFSDSALKKVVASIPSSDIDNMLISKIK